MHEQRIGRPRRAVRTADDRRVVRLAGAGFERLAGAGESGSHAVASWLSGDVTHAYNGFGPQDFRRFFIAGAARIDGMLPKVAGQAFDSWFQARVRAEAAEKAAAR